MKIAVLGCGGIGGLVCAALAKKFNDIYVIARGETLKAVKEKGIYIESDLLGNFTAKPKLATDNVKDIGNVDVLFITSKSYDLENACKQCEPIIGENTVVIPLLNGVSLSDEVEMFLNNKGQIADGCIYAFSSISKPGEIRHIGELCRIEFGFKDKHTNETSLKLEKMLKESGIEAAFSNDIMVPVWIKYIMMCGNSCVFTYFDCFAEDVHADNVKMKYIEDVYTELYNVAKAMDVNISQNVVQKHMETFKRLPKGATTSLHRDIKAGNKSEFDNIIGKGYRLARKANIETPCLDLAYNKNKDK